MQSKQLNEKLKKLSIELKEFGGKSLVSKDLDEILNDSLERGKMIIDYKKKRSKKIQNLKQKWRKSI